MALRDLSDMTNERDTQRASSGRDDQRKTWISLPDGTHRIRWIPSGTGHPTRIYKKKIQHSLRGNIFMMGLCWHHINENIETTRKALIDKQLLQKADWAKYQEFGCPACNIVPVLEEANIRKEVINRAQVREKYDYNIFYRGPIASSPMKKKHAMLDVEEGTYVLSLSKKWKNKVVDYLEMLQNLYKIDTIDPVTGFDTLVTILNAGKLNVEYSFSVFPTPCPITDNPLDVNYYDLTDLETFSFWKYQDMITKVKIVFGKYLQAIGYTIPGDEDPNNNLIDPSEMDVADNELALPSTQLGQNFPEIGGNPTPQLSSPHIMDAKVTKRQAGPRQAPVVETKKGPINPNTGEEYF